MKLIQSINSVCCFELVLGTDFDKRYRENQILLERDLVCDHLKYPKRLLMTNQESPELFLYTFKSVCRTTLETPWGKLHVLLGMKLITDVTLPFLLEVNNDIFIYFLYHRCGLWNQLHQQIFVILVIEMPVQLKWISKKPSWEIIVSCKRLSVEWTTVKIKDLLHDKFSIYWGKDRLLLLWGNFGPVLSNNH